MPTFEIQVGGKTFEVDGPDMATARAVALPAIADQFVANERNGGGVGQGISDTVRNLARGTPVGSWLDEANAATSAGLNKITGGNIGSPYDEAVAYQRATDRAVDKDTGGYGTATKIVGGVASIPMAPMIRAAQGAALLPQVINGMVTGAVYGGAYGAGEGEGTDRLKNAGTGVAIGTTIGGAAPVIARGASNAVGYVADKFKGVPAELRPYHRGAVNRVAGAMSEDAMTPQAYQQQVAMLGPEGMIADLGQNTRLHAETIANRPGRGSNVLFDALGARKEGAPARIAGDVNAALGPPPNLIEAEQAIRAQYGKAAKPIYDQFRNTPVPLTPELKAIQGTLSTEPGIINNARKLATLDGSIDPKQFFAQQGADGTWRMTRVPNASEWDYMKRAVDDMARSAGRGTNEQRIYSGLATKIRDAVDTAISPNDPSASIYAQARKIAGEGIGLRGAMDEGTGAFSRGINPNQMKADMAGMSAAERDAYKLGARGQVADIMGNSATTFGPSGDTAARRALGSEYAKEKLGMVAGEPAANRLLNRLDAESAFEKTRQGVTQNSATARRLAANNLYPSTAESAPSLSDKTAFGMALQGLKWAGNAAVGGAMNERNARIGEDAARLLSASGSERDAFARALMNVSNTKAVTGQTKKQIEMITRLLLRGPTPAAIDAYTGR